MFLVAFFVILLYNTASVVTNEIICVDYIDITDGIKNGTDIIKNGFTFGETHYFVLGDSIKGCICEVKQCIRKCCPEGQKLNFTSKECVSDSDTNLYDFSTFHIINVPTNKICDETKVKIIVKEFKVDEGVLKSEYGDFAMEEYCLSSDGDGNVAIGCVTDRDIPGILYAIGQFN
ncbi:hypothetical protein JTB14_011041 [Gonioctena quinquepunctata]|nr:hypothetical protein JTB14_011041 [Gonioctena quinquepunctata]